MAALIGKKLGRIMGPKSTEKQRSTWHKARLLTAVRFIVGRGMLCLWGTIILSVIYRISSGNKV